MNWITALACNNVKTADKLRSPENSHHQKLTYTRKHTKNNHQKLTFTRKLIKLITRNSLLQENILK